MAPDQPGSGRMSPFLLARMVQCERASRGTLRTACCYAVRLEWLVVRVESINLGCRRAEPSPSPSLSQGEIQAPSYAPVGGRDGRAVPPLMP